MWKTNPIDSFYRSQADADAANAKAKPNYEAAQAAEAEALIAAQAAETAAAGAGFNDATLNADAVKKIDAWCAAYPAWETAIRNASNVATRSPNVEC